MNPLISPTDISKFQQQAGTKIICVQMLDPVSGAKSGKVEGFIPGAITIDLDSEASDHDSAIPHACPSPEKLATLLGNKGISHKDTVLLYDNFGMFCAPRLLWMLMSMGHASVKLINGGLPAYAKSGLPLSDSAETPNDPVRYEQSQSLLGFIDAPYILNTTPRVQVLDARSKARFLGEVPEPRPGLRSGHIPHAISTPYSDLLVDGVFKEEADLTRYFNNKGVNLNNPIVTSCGSGVTACVVGLAALICGASVVSVYDGSWAEWGADHSLPLEC